MIGIFDIGAEVKLLDIDRYLGSDLPCCRYMIGYLLALRPVALAYATGSSVSVLDKQPVVLIARRTLAVEHLDIFIVKDGFWVKNIAVLFLVVIAAEYNGLEGLLLEIALLTSVRPTIIR